jgi:hypothetical protein
MEIGDEATLSKPLHKLTRCVRIVADVDCLIGIDVGKSEPKQFLKAGRPETRIVQPDQNFLISAVVAEPTRSLGGASFARSSGGGAAGLWTFGDLSNALELIARPAAAKERLDAIAAAMAEAQMMIAEANKQQAALVAAEKAHRQMLETTSAEHAAAVAAAQQKFDEERLRQENALTAREARLGEQESKLEAEREALEELHNDLQARAQAFARATEPMRSGRKPA